MKRFVLVLTFLLVPVVASAREWVLWHDGGAGQGWSFAGTQYAVDHPQGGHLHLKYVVVWSGEANDVFGNHINRFGVTGAKQNISEIDLDTAYLEFQVDTHEVVIPDVKVELHMHPKRRWGGAKEFQHVLPTLGRREPGYVRVRIPLKAFAKTRDQLTDGGKKPVAKIVLLNTVRAPVGTVIHLDEVKIIDGVKPDAPAKAEPPPKFVKAPKLTVLETKNDRIISAEVTFEVDRPTDCVVRICDDTGRAVKHLAAGMLGPKAPEPFKPDTLAQKIAWDGTGDDGKPLPGQEYLLKVDAKMTPKLGAFLAEDPQAYSFVHPVGIGVDAQGNVYLLHRAGVMHQSASHVYVFDRDGRYLREISPPNPNVAEEYRNSRQRSNATGSVPSWANRFELACLAHTPGYLWTLGMDHGGSDTYPVVRKLVRIRTDGKGYREYTNTPFWVPKHWNLMWLCPTSPKSMLISDGAPRSKAEAEDAHPQEFATKNPTCYHVVYHALINHYGFVDYPTFAYAGRRKLDKPRAYLGTLREPGDDGEHFNGPTGIARGRDGNIYVCDSGNHKIKVFRHDGFYLREITSYTYAGQTLPLKHCRAVLIGEQGFIHVTVDAETNGKPVKRLVKLHPVHPNKTMATVDLHRLAGFNLALDTSQKPHLLWTTKGGGTGTFTRIEDLGERFGKVTHFGGRNAWKLMQVTSLDVDEDHKVYCVEKNALYQRLIRFDGKGGDTFELLKDWPKLRRFTASTEKVPFFELSGGYNSFVNRLNLTPDGAMVYNHGKFISRFERATGAPMQFRGPGTLTITSDAKDFRYFRGCAVDREGNIYALTHTKRPNTARGAGWNRVVEVWGPGGMSKSTDYLGRIPGPMRDLFVDRTGAVWLFTGSRVYRYRAGKGQLWRKDGFSYSRYDGCGCKTPKLYVDRKLYAYVPDQRNVCVRVLDANGNVVTDIGSYGNRDCRGRFGPEPEPAIPLQNPIATAARDDRLYIADYANLRIVRVDLHYALTHSARFRTDGKVAVPR